MLTEAFNSRLLSPRQALLGATGDALENMIIDPLITGSICFVVAENSFYRLDKASVAAPSGTDIIATSRGTSVPGRWLKMSGSEGSATEVVDFPVPTLAAGAAGQVSVLVAGALPTDVFAISPAPDPDGSAWPVAAIVGQPRCEAAGTLIVPVIAATGGVGSSSCLMRVKRFPA